MNALAARRRHPAAIAILLMIGLFLMGAAYAAVAPKPADATTRALPAQSVEEGKALFRANCASCHGLNAEGRATGNGDKVAGPSLAGVGAAAVDFQVGTGRMPLTQPGVQAMPQTEVKFTNEQIKQMAAYVASLGPGPAVPEGKYTAGDGDVAKGGHLFRVNCAMCHNFTGAGGALTRGKHAPALNDVSGTHIYEAMITGPQAMPVFNDNTLSPEEKRDIIAFLTTIENEADPGGHGLGRIGPVAEGLWGWLIGIGGLIGAAVWLGAKRS